eukprot:SAG11_NODE_8964_length_958_cov_1.267753_2_plen_73_part_01
MKSDGDVLTQACSRCQQPAKAFELFEELQAEYYLQPSPQAYTCLIQACAASADAERAAAVLAEMIEVGHRPGI